MWCVVLFYLVTSAATAKIKPANSYFDICHLSEPQYEECVKKSIQNLKPSLIKGIPELNIHPIEPLRIPKIEMGDGKGNFKLHLVLSNLMIHGTSIYEFKSIKFDFNKKQFSYTAFNPKLDFEGDYSIDGQILVLPINGKGKAVFNFTDVTTSSISRVEEYTKNGKTYIKIVENQLSIEPGFAQSYLTNLFSGDKQLGEGTNRILNENWREAFYSYKELPDKAFSEFFTSVINGVFSKFPKDELFPK